MRTGVCGIRCDWELGARTGGCHEPDDRRYVEISGPTLAIVQCAKSTAHAMLEDFAKKTHLARSKIRRIWRD